MFGGAGREYRWKYGTKRETFAKISVQGAQARAEQPVRAVHTSRSPSRRSSPRDEVFDPLTRYQCCPPTCGAAAAILCSRRVRQEARLRSRVHRRAGHDDRLRRRPSTDEHDQDGRLRHGQARPRRRSTSRPASAPRTCDVVELHDCFTANELLTYEALGLCKEGEAEKFIWDGDNTYGGKCRDEPVGRPALQGPPARRHGPRAVHRAGLAAPRPGRASARSTDAKVALQHNLGLGGACVVTLYEKLS